MSLKNKFFSGITLGAAVFAFSAIGMAQEVTTTTTTPDKVEKVKGDHRGHGKRGMGRGEFGGKFGRGGKGMMGHRGMGMFRFVELTEAQKVQIKAIHEANKPSQEFRDEMMTLRTAKRAGTITADQQARIDTLKAQAKEKHASVKAQIQAILTPEQKAQIETKKAEMKLKMEERRKQRMERKAATPAATTTTDKPKN
ncbi:MAG: Spy/CpxP family protein refolding chaperone [Acidobacteria bacterium]|nr:Spy/CpxP family protein refolding chaperone [Acidobacteriota bacterium]